MLAPMPPAPPRVQSRHHLLCWWLGFSRADPVIIQIFTQRGRSDQVKQDLYAEIARRLEQVGVGGEDIFVGYVENGPQDWSFGFGRAQYLTGELAVPGAAS